MGYFLNGFKRPGGCPIITSPLSGGMDRTEFSRGGLFIRRRGTLMYIQDSASSSFSSINWDPDPATPEMLTVAEPCRGLILFVDGDVNIGQNATISMAKMGSVLPTNPSELIDLYSDSMQMRHIVNALKTLKGGVGGDGGAGKKREFRRRRRQRSNMPRRQRRRRRWRLCRVSLFSAKWGKCRLSRNNGKERWR